MAKKQTQKKKKSNEKIPPQTTTTQDAIILLAKDGRLQRIVEDAAVMAMEEGLRVFQQSFGLRIRSAVEQIVEDATKAEAQFEMFEKTPKNVHRTKKSIRKNTNPP